MSDRCEISRCRAEAAVTYLDRGVCEKHWNHLTAEDAPPEALRISLGIEAMAPTAMEDRTMEPTTEKTAKKGTKAAPKTKAAKPKKERVDMCVFAFRLTPTDRDLIHRAAGPAKATKFVRAAALAAANQDGKAFDELAAQAKTNLK